jgi:colanic acid biosynthesis protein WcaH
MLIERDLYKKITENLPLQCVDIIPKYHGKYVLIKRAEEPMRGMYWVPGGRLNKNEKLRDCALRKLTEELCSISSIDVDSLRLVGVYEDVYDFSQFGYCSTGYHTNAIVFEVELLDIDSVKLDRTSEDWGLFDTLPERFRVQYLEKEVYYEPGWN